MRIRSEPRSFEQVIAAHPGGEIQILPHVAATSLDRLRRICESYVDHQIADGLIAWGNKRAQWRFEHRKRRFARRRGMQATRLFDDLTLDIPHPLVEHVGLEDRNRSVVITLRAGCDHFAGGAE